MAQSAVAALTAAGHEVQIEDLYQSSFSPALTIAERKSYYGAPFESVAVQPQIDRLLLRQPVKQVLKTALLGSCAPACRFEMLSLYKAERPAQPQVRQFCSRIERAITKWR